MVVPYDKKSEVGYRPIPETVPGLKKIFAKIVEMEDSDDEAKKNAAFDALQELVQSHSVLTNSYLYQTKVVIQLT